MNYAAASYDFMLISYFVNFKKALNWVFSKLT